MSSTPKEQQPVQEEEDEIEIEEEIYGNLIEATIGSIVDACVQEVCPENKKPTVYFRQLQKKHPDLQGKIEESLKGVANFFDQHGEQLKEQIKIACDTLLEHLEKL